VKAEESSETESPDPVRTFKKKLGETSFPVTFWTCSRVEVRQYSLVLLINFNPHPKEESLRLILGTSGGDDLVVVVKDLEKGVDNVVVSAGVLEIAGTIVVDLSLGVGQGLVRTPGVAIGTKGAEVAVQGVDDGSGSLTSQHNVRSTMRCSAKRLTPMKVRRSTSFKQDPRSPRAS
jgi:hypothetical protein